MTIVVRPGTESDIDQIAHVLVDTWRSTFRGLVTDAFLDGMSYENQAIRHRRTMGLGAVYFVGCDVDGRVVGFVSGGPIRHPFERCDAELYALYVLDAYQGQGVGTGLLKALAQAMAERGLSHLLVWVLAGNPCASFYEAKGARPISTAPIQLGSEEVDQVAYVWDGVR